jgi:DNA polymerase-3 subunit epsilon
MSAAERDAVRLAPGARKQPGPQRRIAIIFTACGLIGFALFAILFGLAGDEETIPHRAYSGAALALILALGLVWLLIQQMVIRPAMRLGAEARLIAEARSDAPMNLRAYRALGPLPDAVAQLAGQLIAAQREIQGSVAEATRRVGEEKERLEAILRDLSEGVLVCNLEHHVLLYNQVALSLLHVSGELGLGRSLFQLVTREPILHGLQRLTQRSESGHADDAPIPVVCATSDSRTLLSGRMSLVLDPAQQPTGYVLTFTDATRSIAELSQRDLLLRHATEGLRQPIANLRAAAETISSFPEISANERRAFEEVILREGSVLSERLEALDRDYRSLNASQWPMADIHSVDLFSCVVRNLTEAGGPAVTMVGLPLWLHGDSHSLALALERILGNLVIATGAGAFDIEALLGDKRVYVEITWPGEPLPSATIDAWCGEQLPGALGLATLRDVLSRHGSEIWSRSGRPGRALLRIPLPAPTRIQFAPPARPNLQPRPEFYDFDLLRQHDRERRTAEKLRAASYVVFDTETTGLRPSQGDEMISIGAVRIVNGRILTGETFSRLINPRRAIPAESIQFHGITDAMVADAPPIEVVMPQFKAFVADSPLIAHNAAFDLKFLSLKEEQCGIRFDNVALDTLLISALLYPEFDDHSLDALADRLGVAITARHTALGDAMATAAVFVKLLDLLEARGITTLSALLDAASMVLAIRAAQTRF